MTCWGEVGWEGATRGAGKNRGIIRFNEEDVSRLKVFVLNEAAQFVLICFWICNWNRRIAPSVNISEEETNSERSEVNFWLLTGPDSGSNITGVWRWCWWTVEQEVTSVESSELETQSHVMLCVPTWPRGNWGRRCHHSQHGVSLQDWMNLCPCLRLQEEGEKKLFVPREMSVNQLTELSVEVWVLRSLQLLELREPACNSDGTWQMELPLLVPRKEQ